MTTPTLHLNGSNSSELFADYQAALDAVRAAQKALTATAPNGRDYYPQGPAAIYDAVEEHVHRVEALDRVARELEALALAVFDQQEQRRRRK